MASIAAPAPGCWGVAHAAGQVTAHYRDLTMQRQRKIPAGGYTLILLRAHRTNIVPVMLR